MYQLMDLNLTDMTQKNFNEENVSWNSKPSRMSISHCPQGFVSFTLQELEGVPQDVISGYTKRTEDGKELYDVTHKTPDIFPLVCMRRGFFLGDAS
jgi:hypothetical protein